MFHSVKVKRGGAGMSTATLQNKDLSNIDIIEVARRLGLNPRHNGQDKAFIFCPNPECEENRNKRPHHYELGGDNRHLGHCRKCKASHNPLSFVKTVKGCDAKAAYDWLEDKGFKEPSEYKSDPTPTDPIDELANRRGWTRDALETIGATSKGRKVLFPMFDADGQRTGTKKRKGDNSAFFDDVNSLTGKDEQHGLFYPADGLPDRDPVLLVEGEADTVAAISAGYDATIGTAGMGIGSDALDWLQDLLQGRDVVMAPDPGTAGRSWRDKAGRALANVQCDVRYIPAANNDNDLDDRLKYEENKAETLQGFIHDAKQWIEPNEQYFNGKTFVPLNLARDLQEDRELCFGYDPETDAGRLMEYDGGVWRPAVNIDVDAQNRLGDRTRPNRVNTTLYTLKRDVPQIPWPVWNTNRRLINCKDGMLDPQTDELQEHRPDYYSTFQAPVSYDPTECDPIVERFLNDVLPDDALELACEMMGYLLIPSLAADKFFVLEGPGGTGKSTFFDAFLNVMGEKSWAEITLQDLAENRFASARLENKLLGCFDDMGSTPMKTVSKVKALTGGHKWLSVERKGDDQYKAPLYARLLFTCNEMPRGADKGQAWYDRLCILPFENRFRNTGRDDKDMPEKLARPSARRTLFALAVGGLQTLMENDWQFSEPESVAVELDEYRKRNDSVAAFVDERCTINTGLKANRTLWYEEYREWAEDAGLHPVSRRKAYRRLREDYNCEDYQTDNGTRMFKGVGLVTQ